MNGSEFVIDTDAGPQRCVVRGGEVEVAMRPPSFAPVDVPVAAEQPVLGAEWQLGEHALRVSAVSVGNPHAVTFDDVGDARAVLGPLLGTGARFPQGANAGFAVLRDNGLHLHVFERGAGWTQACGTGACAAAAVAVETGRAKRGAPIAVHLPGGTLQITVGAASEPIQMVGPARHVFDGVVEHIGFAPQDE